MHMPRFQAVFDKMSRTSGHTYVDLEPSPATLALAFPQAIDMEAQVQARFKENAPDEPFPVLKGIRYV